MRNTRVFIILLFMISCCYFLNHSYATNTATVYLSSSQDIVEKDEEIEITVNVESKKIAAFHFSLYFDESKLECISNLENSNVVGNRIVFVWYDSKGGNEAKEGELAKFRFRAKEDGLVTFTVQGEFYDEKAQLIQTDFKEKQVQIGKEESVLQKQAKDEQANDTNNRNTSLQVLRLDTEGLIPKFDQDVYEYYLTIPNDIQDIDVLAISENPKATIKVTGNTGLKEGFNLIRIEVISEDQTQNNSYTIQVTKTANMELANTNLEILAIENVLLNPPFDNTETNYNAEVSNATEEINLLAVPENEQASVEVTGKDDLKEGNNLVTVLVTAPNGFSKKKYQVEVNRRNLEEEARYQQEQAEQKEQLEEAYKIEELSSDMDKIQEQATTEQSKKYQNIIVWIALVIIVAFVIVGVLWKKKYKKGNGHF